jgi:hypothetical protein
MSFPAGVNAGSLTTISGNVISGLSLGVGTGLGTQVQGNLIGTDATGTYAIPNGLGVSASANALIGGTAPGAGNTIALNDGPAVEVFGTGVQIEGNSIHDNSGPGLEAQGTGDQIDGNSIYSNAGPGVWVQSDPFGSEDPFGPFSDGLTNGVSIQRNSIYGNGGLGISLGSIAVDASGNPLTLQQVQDSLQSNPGLWDHDEPSNTAILNDGLGHAGANNYQDFPVLSSASSSSKDTLVTGTFSSGSLHGQPLEPNQAMTLDFYAIPNPDPTGYGQGQTYLGSTTILTDQNGNISTFSIDLPVGGFANQWLTATATDQGGTNGTSEFSAALPILAPGEIFAQFLQTVVPQSSPTANALTIPVSPSATPATVIAAVNGLTNVTQPLTIILDLGGGTYSSGGIAANPPPNVTFVVQNGTLDPTYPALTVAGSQVSVLNCTLTTSGDVPTLLITGGQLTLRNDVIQESTGFNDPAIAVTSGILDLGTTTSPGGNTINVHVGSAVIQNSTSTPISTVDDAFTVNGSPLTPSSSLSGVVWEDFNNDGQVDFGEKGISGVTIALSGKDFLGNAVSQSQQTDSNGAYVFLNLLPGTYTLTETPPTGYLPGIDSVGTGGGSVAASGQISVPLGAEFNGLNYNFGQQPLPGSAVQKGQTAGIGFWNNKKGQALILALNGGSGHQLGDWLAATLPNIFGAYAGGNDLAGQSNAAVAAFFQQKFVQKGDKLDVQLLATALSVYVTNATLDPKNVAASYGFTVSGDGVGTAMVNVGASGDAFGVANNSVLTVMDLLLDANAQAVGGVLYNGDATKRNEANTVFSAVNGTGGL